MTSDDLDRVAAEERALARSLRQLAEETANEQASSHVEAALLAAFRKGSWSRERAGLPTWLLRAAALLLVVGGGVWGLSRMDFGARDGSAPTSARSIARPSEDAIPATGDENGDEILTSFVPLPYGGGTAYLESAHVVRMELPRSALVTLGVAVPEEQWTERMQAEVLFGEDGLARGVRLVKRGTEN